MVRGLPELGDLLEGNIDLVFEIVEHLDSEHRVLRRLVDLIDLVLEVCEEIEVELEDLVLARAVHIGDPVRGVDFGAEENLFESAVSENLDHQGALVFLVDLVLDALDLESPV